jgi:glycosyltransferase involved in cell wall biosynthesis
VVNFTMQVRDRFTLTKQALESLEASALETMTVTILDDRSQDETREFLLDWCGKRYCTHLVRNDEPLGTGQLRNLVISESEKYFGRGDYLAPHDNDVYFKPGWLGALLKGYLYSYDHDFRLLAGYGHPYHLPIATLPVRKGSYVLFNIHEVMAIATQSTFMDWETWDKYGPYCDTPVDKTCQSEDVDFTNKIRADGYKLGVVTPHLIHATALKNTFGQPGPGWELVKAACPEGIICE